MKHVIIIGLGPSGWDFINELTAHSSFGSTDIKVIAVDSSRSSGRILGAKPIHIVAHLKELQREHILGAILVLCVQPQSMGPILHEIKELPIAALVIEKPGPMPYGTYLNVLNRIQRRGVIICVVHQRQYADHFIWASQVIKSGMLGEVDSAVVTLSKWDYQTAGTHWAALCHNLFGQIHSVFGNVTSTSRRQSKYGYPIEDSALWVAFHETGSRTIWQISRGERSDLRVTCSRGQLNVKYPDAVLASCVSDDGIKVCSTYGTPRAELVLQLTHGIAPVQGCRLEDLTMYLQMFRAACESSRTHRQILLSGLHDNDIDLGQSLINLSIGTNENTTS